MTERTPEITVSREYRTGHFPWVIKEGKSVYSMYFHIMFMRVARLYKKPPEELPVLRVVNQRLYILNKIRKQAQHP